MNSSDGNFNDKEDHNFEILPVPPLSQLPRKAKWEHQWIVWLDHIKKLQYEKCSQIGIECPIEAVDAIVDLLYGQISYNYSKMAVHLVKIP